MGVSPGTGAGIGIACFLLVLFIAGPVAYRHRKKTRLQQQTSAKDLEAEQTPQLDGSQVSPSTQRASGMSQIGQWIPEVDADREVRGIGIYVNRSREHPIPEADGQTIPEAHGQAVAELHVERSDERAELDTGTRLPERAELRADLPTPAASSPKVQPISNPQLSLPGQQNANLSTQPAKLEGYVEGQ